MIRFLLLFLTPSFLFATQTALFWTYCTTDVVPPGKGNFEVANLFRAVNNRHDSLNPFVGTVPFDMFPTDLGFDIGLPECGPWQGELGIDYLAGVDSPIYFNAKVAAAEGKLFYNAPSFSVGIFSIGTTQTSAFNVFDFVVGKSIPRRWGGGRVFAGGYWGSHRIGRDRAGWWVGYDLPFYKKKTHKGVEFYRWHFLADYASGKNIVGGGGFGVSYFVTPDIALSTGPTWFNSAKIYGPWKWALYINIIFPVWRKPKGCS